MEGRGVDSAQVFKASHLLKNLPLDPTLRHLCKFLFVQDPNTKRNIKLQEHRQCSTLDDQKDFYGDIIKKSNGVKQNLWSKKNRGVNKSRGRGEIFKNFFVQIKSTSIDKKNAKKIAYKFFSPPPPNQN